MKLSDREIATGNWREFVLNLSGRIICLGSVQIKLNERTTGMSQPCLCCMILFTELYWDIKI